MNSAKHRPGFSAESFPDWFARTGKNEKMHILAVLLCCWLPRQILFSHWPYFICPSTCAAYRMSVATISQHWSILLIRNIQNDWSFFKSIVLHLLGKFAQNPVMAGAFGGLQMCISTRCSGDRSLCNSAQALQEQLVNSLHVQQSAGLQESLVLAFFFTQSSACTVLMLNDLSKPS